MEGGLGLGKPSQLKVAVGLLQISFDRLPRGRLDTSSVSVQISYVRAVVLASMSSSPPYDDG